MTDNPKRNYDDIINLPHHVSARHPQMSQRDRAAQFSPFAALSGHDAAIRETARLTENPRDLDENYADALDRQIRLLRLRLEEAPRITVRYFQPDTRKAGGAYVTASGRLKKIDDYRKLLVLEDRTEIPVSRITAISEET